MVEAVVITGIGLVTALGEGPEAHWQALTGGAAPVVDNATFAPFPVHPLPPLELDRQIPKKGDQRQMEPWQRLGTYAAGLAIDHAGARDQVRDMHMIVAAGGGERDIALDQEVAAELAALPVDEAGRRLNEKLATGLRPTLFLAQLSNLLAGNISIVHGVTGSSRSFMGEESAAADALRIATLRLSEGRGGIALVGGAFVASRWDMLMLYNPGNVLWHGAHVPPSARGMDGGLVLGGMACFLVLETASHAAARGARPLARIAGIAADASRRDAKGKSAAAARAMWDKLSPLATGRLGVVSGASGAAPSWGEEQDFLSGLGAEAIRTPSTLIGHGVEAGFPVNVALGALALSQGGFYPPLDPADPGTLDRPDRVLVTGFGQWRGEALALLTTPDPHGETADA